MTLFDKINLIIAILALLVAIASLFYSFWMNRRKLDITDCTLHTGPVDPPLACFTIHSYSSVPITITDIAFYRNNEQVAPLTDYEPKLTFSGSGHFRTPNIIPAYKYAQPITGKQALHPHSFIELSYYFSEPFSEIVVRVTCKERINGFKRVWSYPASFTEEPDE